MCKIHNALNLKYGYEIPATCKNVQEKVKTAGSATIKPPRRSSEAAGFTMNGKPALLFFPLTV